MKTIKIASLNSALNMMLAVPAFATALKTPGGGRIDVSEIDRQSVDFIERICQNGCGAVVATNSRHKIFAFRDCVLVVKQTFEASLIRDAGRVKLTDAMTERDVEAIALAA